MSDETKRRAETAYDHTREVEGSTSGAPDPALEHQDLATGGGTTQRNEIEADARREPPSGPTPQSSVRTVTGEGGKD